MNLLYKLLSKYSRIKRDGPSKNLFFSNHTLEKINQNNSYEKKYYFNNDKLMEKKYLHYFINNNFNIVDKYEFSNPNNITYIHYVIENGKYKFHDDLEIIIFNDYIKFRSASRVGKYDFNVNKNRIDFIIKNFLSKNQY